MTRIGIFPGTFDPVHNGHLAFARAALGICRLDRVVFLPERAPRHKTGVSNFAHRTAMLQAAIVAEPRFALLTLPEAQFTATTTLPELQKAYPQDALVLLLGTDIAKNLPHWDNVQRIYNSFELAIGLRAHDAKPALPVAATFVPTDFKHAAASDIRTGKSREVPIAVGEYIQANGLYTVQ